MAGKLARWSFFLEEFNMKIIHKSGASLTNADGLSRCATASNSETDAAIKLDAISALEEDDYADSCEILLEPEGSEALG